MKTSHGAAASALGSGSGSNGTTTTTVPQAAVILNSPTFNAPTQVGGQGNVIVAGDPAARELLRAVEESKRILGRLFPYGYALLYLDGPELHLLEYATATGFEVDWAAVKVTSFDGEGVTFKLPELHAGNSTIGRGVSIAHHATASIRSSSNSTLSSWHCGRRS